MSDNTESASAQWIKNYAQSIGVSYRELMTEADAHIRDGSGHITGGDNLDGESTPEEFWKHYRIVRGIEFMPDDPGNFFSCSC